MDRMVQKGYLTTERIRHITLYRPASTCEQAQRGDLLQTLKRAFNGALTPMVQCLLDSDAITSEELAAIERLIKEKRHKAKSK